MSEEHSMTEAMELWKRVSDWIDSPFVEMHDLYLCFFCKGLKYRHNSDCVFTKAMELVKADERGLVE